MLENVNSEQHFQRNRDPTANSYTPCQLRSIVPNVRLKKSHFTSQLNTSKGAFYNDQSIRILGILKTLTDVTIL